MRDNYLMPRLHSKYTLIKFMFVLLAGSVVLNSCKSADANSTFSETSKATLKSKGKPWKFRTGADNIESYLSLIQNKKAGIVTNQSGLISYDTIFNLPDSLDLKNREAIVCKTRHIVDYLADSKKVNLVKIFAPEHGFRGTADAGELVIDGKDLRTGIPIVSIYGNNKKPTPEQLQDIDVMLFDLQDVGTRFYTYISTLHYIMEACAENKIPLIILDRPNPNRGIIDGPVLEPEHSSFVGMHPIPVLHGMTIGEYALMINGQKWLKNGIQCDVKVVACEAYNRNLEYSLPVRPSPNLPNDQAINLYPSLCFFEGTNVSVGRGTPKQFQIYGSPYLPEMHYEFTPGPNLGSKDPPHNGKICCGEDLSGYPRLNRIELKWLISAYNATTDKGKFFIPYFTKLAGTQNLQRQIELGLSEEEIRYSWQNGLDEFKKIRKIYEIY